MTARTNRVLRAVCALLTGLASLPAAAPGQLPYQDQGLSFDARARDLLGRMTLPEKASLLRYDAPAIDRLGIPAYNWWSEALHGVARAGRATVFPQVIGLAATFDEPLLGDIGRVISDEARAKHHAFAATGRRDIYQGLTIFTPNINIFRDPRWGRGQETFGEDPYLTARLAVAFVRAMQGNDPKYLKVGTTAKHYAVHSGPEPVRHVFDVRPTQRDLWDTYLPAFEALVREAHVESVMCAYNRFRGDPACASTELLGDILRKRWSFEGYVVSDCWALVDFYETHKVVRSAEEAAALGIKRGTDVNCGVSFQKLPAAVTQGLATEANVDSAALRALRTRFRLGMFDDSAAVPWTRIPYSVVGSPAHHALALKAARESIVLLQNDGVLPFSPSVRNIAVIGPNARALQVLLGNYNGTAAAPSYPLDALRQRAARVTYAQGSEVTTNVPVMEIIPATALRSAQGGRGLEAAYFGDLSGSGKPAFTRVDSTVDFTWMDRTPINGARFDTFSVRWTGRLVAPRTGRYRIGFKGMNAMKLFFEDSLRVDFGNRHAPVSQAFDVALQANQAYNVRIDFSNYGPDPQAHFIWAPPRPNLLPEAVAAARAADAVMLFLGITPDVESEEDAIDAEGFKGGDRTTIELPRMQQELLEAVTAVGKPTVLVLLSGSTIAVPWASEHVNAIVQAWYPGEAGGQAIADVLYGTYNPSGRLPVTMYRATSDLPPFEDYNMEGHTYRFFRGAPLFPFGHGLSYTRFEYGNLAAPVAIAKRQPARLAVTVRNVGTRAGDEVVQVYVSHQNTTLRVPLRTLIAFQRISLAPGERRVVEFAVPAQHLEVVNENGERIWLGGNVEIAVGGKQPGFSGQADASTTGVVRKTIRLLE